MLLLLSGIAGVISFLIATPLGVIATIQHSKMVNAQEGGSWPVFLIITAIIFFLMLWLGSSYLSPFSQASEYLDLIPGSIKASICFAAAPGTALICAYLGVIYAQEK